MVYFRKKELFKNGTRNDPSRIRTRSRKTCGSIKKGYGPKSKKALKTANKQPGKVTVRSTQFDRNADVIAEVLERADGICESCYQPVPFIRKDFTPYLEVHHKIPLAEGGEDTIENAIAVCPNCHQKEHFAVDIVTVVAGIIIEKNQIMIAQRDGQNELTGKWEFPGGKVEIDETFEQGLCR
ncbi:MAG TPA: HNH endonuclease [Sphingobacterium sp.]|nr:HNH endonuclease [Sphingobacterium sp.]